MHSVPFKKTLILNPIDVFYNTKHYKDDLQVSRTQIIPKIFLEDKCKMCYPRLHVLLAFSANNSGTWHAQVICSSSIFPFSPEHLFLLGK